MYTPLRSEELAALKVGDRVITGSFNGSHALGHVLRVTATQITVRDSGDFKYSRKQGYRIGDGYGHYGRKHLFRADDSALSQIAKTECAGRIISMVYTIERSVPKLRKNLAENNVNYDQLVEIEHYVKEAYKLILETTGNT